MSGVNQSEPRVAENVISLRETSKILAQLKGERFMGGLIAKAVWQRGGNLPEEEGLTVLRDRRDTVVACGRVGDASLTLTMLLGRFDPQDLEKEIAAARAEAAKENIANAGSPWHVFSPEEIGAFVQAVGDVNTIHQGDRPVVPGLLILEQVLKTTGYADVSSLTLKFIRPAFSGETLSISEEARNRFTIRGAAAFVQGIAKSDLG